MTKEEWERIDRVNAILSLVSSVIFIGSVLVAARYFIKRELL
jgi:hypothetical protein